jgi:adenylylsulfate kinase
MGISGAGKTTIGSKLVGHFVSQNKRCCMIDGEEARGVFDGDLGYTREDREANVKRIILAGYALDKCGILAIICNISPFEHLRRLCRQKIPGYNEIYLKKRLQVSITNDVKNMYSNNMGKTDIVGMEINFDEPSSPDLVIEVDNETVEDTLARVVAYIDNKLY